MLPVINVISAIGIIIVIIFEVRRSKKRKIEKQALEAECRKVGLPPQPSRTKNSNTRASGKIKQKITKLRKEVTNNESNNSRSTEA